MNALVKSKQRVADHGEVFTPSWMVEAMLDLVKGETERIDSRFLEPACGSGNFLVRILQRNQRRLHITCKLQLLVCDEQRLFDFGIAFGAHAKGPDPAYGKQQDATISQVKGNLAKSSEAKVKLVDVQVGEPGPANR